MRRNKKNDFLVFDDNNWRDDVHVEIISQKARRRKENVAACPT